MSIKSISAKAWLFSAMFAFIVVIQFITQYNTQSSLNTTLTHIESDLFPTFRKVYSLKLSVTEVQQWLQDISSTRGMDGLDDGFTEAEKQASFFLTTVNELIDQKDESSDQYRQLIPVFKEYYKTGKSMAEKYVEGGPAEGNKLMASFDNKAQAIHTLIDQIVEQQQQNLSLVIQGNVNSSESSLNLLKLFSIIFLALLICLLLANKFMLSKPLHSLALIIENMHDQQREKGSIDIDTAALNTDTKTELGTITYWVTQLLSAINEKHLQELNIANESKRVKQALDAASTNVMMADADFNIIYMNPAVQNMMKLAEDDLRKELPNFVAKDLVGKNIDLFHKNPAHQRSMLERLQDVYRTTITVGERTFNLTATPIFDEHKKRLGTVVEWYDRTAEVKIENEISHLITAANDGDLTQRINPEGKSGFGKMVSDGLNSLMNTTATFVGDVGVVFQAMSEGDLTKAIQNDYKGELLQIKDNANNSIAKLTEVLSKIQSASDIVRTSSNEVAQGSDDLSRRTESQASSLEETAASMEEITATVKQTAESATQSNTLASEAKLKAEKGGDVVQGAVKAMSEIMESSNKINDIIGVIDEIAFQTNLLALNAAVEAARAGEQGRGFAVVAGEVRTLSQRSAAAAKEIKDLIRDSVNKVESGSHLVNQSGQMLSEIVQAVDKVAKMIADVNTAAIEQNSGISQINQAVTQMDEMTQQNAALVEQTSAASRSMSEEANSMSRLISFFQLSRNGGFVGASANSPQEPIMTYQPVSASPAKSSPSKPAPNKGSGSAASFSSEDDWEDF